MLFLIPGIKFAIKGTSPKSLFHLTVRDIAGKPISLSVFKGKKLLIVNTASFCGFTPQYKALQTLYERFQSSGLVLLAFPCNDFGQQEPDDEEKIGKFCRQNFNLSFELMEKIHVKGKFQHPLYRWLTSKKLNGVINSRVLWNFQKYLVNEDGELVDVLAPWSSPLCNKILKWLEK